MEYVILRLYYCYIFMSRMVSEVPRVLFECVVDVISTYEMSRKNRWCI